MVLLTWIGILACLSQSAILSGLNLAFFSLSRLELQARAKQNDRRAQRILAMRDDANFTLVTILWGNVAVNVLLALLSGSVLAGVTAFLFSTVVITLFAEIAPQAYFSRNALKVASLLAPVLRFYRILLFPVAKPTALVLDRWLGREAIQYFRERDLREVIKLHMESTGTDIAKVEGQGALNFLDLDDVPFTHEGEAIDPDSVIQVEFENGRPVFPDIAPVSSDAFLQQLHQSRKTWIVLTDSDGEPRMLLKSDDFIRDALFSPERFNPYRHCHRPILVKDDHARLGELIPRLQVTPRHAQDDIIDQDVILLWGDEKRLVTGSDILGRLLRGIVKTTTAAPA